MIKCILSLLLGIISFFIVIIITLIVDIFAVTVFDLLRKPLFICDYHILGYSIDSIFILIGAILGEFSFGGAIMHYLNKENTLLFIPVQIAGVGLSNICYTVLDEIMECIFWRFPSKRSHWEAVIISIIISFELYSEIFKREETMRGIKAFVILAMTAFYFPIVPWGKGANLFVLDA